MANRILIFILLMTITTVSAAQLPDCVKTKCDAILRKELGKKVFSKCVEYIDYECTKELDTITDTPCEAYSRHSYEVRYKFSFPKHENAFFKIGFVCTGYFGKMHIQSEYFLRTDQSDLPVGFRRKGLKIMAYEKIAKIAYERDPKVQGKGVLALSQDKVFWVFTGSEPYVHANGIGDEAMIVHTVWVDPYSGEIIDSQIRRE